MTGAAVETEIGGYRVEVATGFGPRITGLRLGDGPETLAVLGPDVVIDRPDSGVYRFWGGHRLWAAPEIPTVTYAPDDGPCEVTTAPGSITTTGAADAAGLEKQITITADGGRVRVDHFLTNRGRETVEVAPWAITQLPLGGTVILPISGEPSADTLIADRSLVLWPYTDLTDPRISFAPRVVVIDAVPGPALKVGSGPRPGHAGYLVDGQLFTKTIIPEGAGPHPDRGAVGQAYVNDRFCELESMGALALLEPGMSISHIETWEITRCDGVDTAVALLTGETPG